MSAPGPENSEMAGSTESQVGSGQVTRLAGSANTQVMGAGISLCVGLDRDPAWGSESWMGSVVGPGG